MSAPGRELRSPGDLESLRFDDRGLLPVVAQEADSGAVLMVAWANREALAQALATGQMHYWSRSRGELWRKGATSGHVQDLVSLHVDCDGDTLLARVRQTGPACHTGAATCFGEPREDREGSTHPGAHAGAPTGSGAGTSADTRIAGPHILDALWEVLEARDRERPEGSWTTRLLTDENLRLKKLGEETVELVTALVRGDARAPEEAADLVYHLLVALKGAGFEWEAVKAELEARRT